MRVAAVNVSRFKFARGPVGLDQFKQFFGSHIHDGHALILRLPADIGAHMNHSLAVLRFAFSCLLADLIRPYRKARP